jgi:hypothetical protein
MRETAQVVERGTKGEEREKENTETRGSATVHKYVLNLLTLDATLFEVSSPQGSGVAASYQRSDRPTRAPVEYTHPSHVRRAGGRTDVTPIHSLTDRL